MSQYTTIDEYISQAPKNTQEVLEKIRRLIKTSVPAATEKISYGIPTFYLNGNLIHFGGYENFVSIYPGAAPLENFADKLKAYKTSKGTVQFPLDQPIPYDLIEEILNACVKRNLTK